jgi:hypothetical protein
LRPDRITRAEADTDEMSVATRPDQHVPKLRFCVLAAPAVVFSAVALAACGGGSRHATTTTGDAARTTAPARTTGAAVYVNKLNAERLIEQRIAQQRHQHVNVSCPANVPLRTGHQFICRAAIPGGQNVLLVVTVLDPAGRLHFQPATS